MLANLTTEEEPAFFSIPDIGSKVVLSILNVIFLIFSQAVFTALLRTRHTPMMVRFLGCSTVELYGCLVSLIFLRKFVTNYVAEVIIVTIIFGIRDVTITNVSVISLERLIGFLFPFFYRRLIEKKIAVSLVVILWISTFSTCSGLLIAHCSQLISVRSDKVEKCVLQSPVMVRLILLGMAFIVNTISTISIVTILKRKAREYGLPKRAKYYKVSMVMLCSGATCVVISVVIVIVTSVTTDMGTRAIIFEYFIMLNGLLDTILYAVWFSECRLELLKMVAFFAPKLRDRVEKMRLQVLPVVLPEQNQKRGEGCRSVTTL